MSKAIAYLDHNFVSNLTKARLGRIRDVGEQGYYARLLQLLDRLVLDNRIVCPQSTSHELEAEFDRRLEHEIIATIGSLARGVAFLDDTQVLCNQVTKALCTYLGKHPPEWFGPWAEAFEEDPHAPAVRDLPAVDARIRVPGRPERARWLKKRYVEDIRIVRRRRLGQPLTFQTQIRRETLSLADSCYFEAFRRIHDVLVTGHKGIDALDGTLHALALHRTYCELTGVEQTLNLEPQFLAFFQSHEFASAPYVHICSSLHAASLVYSPERQPQQGDLYDMGTMSTVLPYCDIVATDRHMQWLIRQVGLDTQYGVEVFSARKADLTAFFDRLTALAWVRA